ncbi:MAG: sodium:proton antiporter [Actinomycetales bacterium]|nr:MAG: sodium:proton antiporter [Actinomycetales bacterium]
MRIIRFFSYLWYLTTQIISGSAVVVSSALSKTVRARPCIVEFPLRCESDFEIVMLASSITITPGTLVLGVAAARENVPATFFVHSLYDNNRETVLAGLKELETKLLNVTRNGVVQ